MSAEAYTDADAFFAERRRADTRKRQVLRLFDVDYELPTQTPVGYMMLEQRFREESNVEALRAVLTPVYGPDAMEDWGDAGMGAEDLMVVLAWTTANLTEPGSMTLAQAAEAHERAEGKAPTAPNRATRRAAAKTAARPKRTRTTSGTSS